MKNKIRLRKMKIKQESKDSLPLFYQFILYNKLEPGDPWATTEFSDLTQSMVFYEKPEKPVSKIIDFNEIMEKV